MKKPLYIFLTFIFILSACDTSVSMSCQGLVPSLTIGKGEVESQVRPLSGFNQIQIENSADVVVHVGKEFRVEVTAQKNILSILKTKVQGDKLVLRTQGSFSTYKPISVKVNVPSLNHLSVLGSGDSEVYNIKTDHFSLETTGSGNVYIKGQAQSFNVNMTGSGHVNAKSFMVQQARVTKTGSGDLKLNCKEQLSINSTGSGDIKYKGNPHISQSITGSGRLKSID